MTRQRRGAGPARCLLVAILGVALADSAVAAEADAARQQPLFVVHSVDGTTAPGRLHSLSDGWSIALDGEKPARVRGSDFIALRRLEAPSAAPPSEAHLILANGDHIPGEALELTQERLRIDADLGTKQPMQLSLDVVAAFWFQSGARPGDPAGARFRRRLLAERRRRDVVLLKNGDLVEGSLIRLDAKSLTIQSGPKKTIPVERDKVAAVALNSDFMRSPRVKGAYAQLVLANGCRLSLAEAQVFGETLTGKTLFGVSVKVPVEQIIALDLLQGRAIYLSTLKPRRYEYTPFLGNDYHGFVADGNWEEAELRLAGRTYDRGLGMHSKSTLTYDVPDGCRRFEALVGIDDGADRGASAGIEVYVDGKRADLGWKNPVSRLDGPRTVRVDLPGAKELRLVVDWGRQGFVQGRVNWADARLVK